MTTPTPTPTPTPTGSPTGSPNVVRAALVKGATFLRCSICSQAVENLAESRAGLGLHPLGTATGSRDVP